MMLEIGFQSFTMSMLTNFINQNYLICKHTFTTGEIIGQSDILLVIYAFILI